MSEAMITVPSIDDIRDSLAFLDDWEERYRYVIDLGRALPALSEAERTEANRVRGCASQVWLAAHRREGPNGPVLDFVGDSDAHIVRGLVAIILALFSGKTPREILAIDARGLFDELGLSAHLTAQRSNGLFAMIERIRADAAATLAN